MSLNCNYNLPVQMRDIIKLINLKESCTVFIKFSKSTVLFEQIYVLYMCGLGLHYNSHWVWSKILSLISWENNLQGLTMPWKTRPSNVNDLVYFPPFFRNHVTMTKPQIPVCIAGNFSLNCKNRLKKVTEFAVYRNLQFPVFAVIFTYVYEAYQTNGS